MTRLAALVTLRELGRRRGALVLITLLPLVFFVVELDTHWTALRLLSMGTGWAVATLALFAHVSARRLDQRLVVAGARPGALFVGRQLGLTALGLGLALVGIVLVLLTIADDLHRVWPVALLLVTTVAISVPTGALVAVLVPRELEGALALLSVMAVQVLVDPEQTWTRVLPLWSARELAGYAVEPVGQDYLARGLLHALVAWGVLGLAAHLVSVRRLSLAPLRRLTTPSAPDHPSSAVPPAGPLR